MPKNITEQINTMDLITAEGCCAYTSKVLEADSDGEFLNTVLRGQLLGFRDFLKLVTVSRVQNIVIPKHHRIAHYSVVAITNQELIELIKKGMAAGVIDIPE